MQKLREAYNDLLAQYNQYSTMDARQVELEKTKAEATLKELQKDLAKAQKELEKLKAEDEYVQAQADKTTYQTEYDACKKEIDEYTAQIKELQSGKVIRSVSEIQADINAAEQKKEQLLRDYASRLAEHEAMYQEFSKLAGGREEIMDAYQADRDLLIRTLIEQGYGKTTPGNGAASGVDEAAVGATADAMIAAYKALKGYYTKAAALEDDLARLNAELKIAQSTESTADALAKLSAKLEDANKRLKDADMKLNSAKRIVDSYEAEIEALEGKIERAQNAVDTQQDKVDRLTSANTLAEQVKSAKQALEDKIFEQGLADGSALDLEAAKKAIDEKKADIEKLTQNADEVEVKAKVGGTVSAINVTAGNNAGAETPLMTLNLTDRGYTVKISVTNEQAKKVRVGDSAELVNYWYGGDIQATLENITNDPSNPGKARLLVFRLTGDVEPDTNLTLSIGQKSANYDCIVPNSAIRTDSNGTFVLAIVAKSTPLRTRYTATRVDVQELAKDDTVTAVTGLSSGDFVITTSTKPIEAGTQVRLVENN